MSAGLKDDPDIDDLTICHRWANLIHDTLESSKGLKVNDKYNNEKEVFEIHSSFCRVFSNPKRLFIMWLLAEQELSVGEIADELGMSISNTSQHLRIMKDQGAVRARRDAQTIYYTVANKNFSRGARLVRKGLIEEHRIPQDLITALSTPPKKAASPRSKRAATKTATKRSSLRP